MSTIVLPKLSSLGCQLFLRKTPLLPCTSYTPLLQILSFHLVFVINLSTLLSWIKLCLPKPQPLFPICFQVGFLGLICKFPRMLHTREPIFMLFEIIPSCCYCCLWGYPQVSGLSARGQQIVVNGKRHWWFSSYYHRRSVFQTYLSLHYPITLEAILRTPIPTLVWSFNPQKL